MSDSDYSFQYIVMTNTASIRSGQLKIKQGMKKWDVPISSLKFLYVKNNESANADELLISYEVSAGKMKKIRCYSDEGQTEFVALVEALVALRPDIDIRDLPSKEAFAKLGAADTEKIAFFIAPLIVVGIVAVICLPWLIHGMDGGQERVSAKQLAGSYEPKSRNLIVTGRAVSKYIEETTTRKGTTTKKLFIPIIPADFKRGDKIRIVLETGELSQHEVNQLLAKTEFPGILRNVLWEGLAGSNRDFFVNDIKLAMAEEVLLIDYKSTPGTDLMISLLVLGITFVIMLIVAVVMWVQRYKKE